VNVLRRVPTPYLHSPAFLARIGVLGVIALAAFGILWLRLWSLQVLNGVRFRSTAQQEVVRVVRLPALRGAIVDDRGRLLAATSGETVVSVDAQLL